MSSGEFDSSENDSVMTDDDSNWNSFELDTESKLDDQYVFDNSNFVGTVPDLSTDLPSKFQFRSEPGVHVANDNNEVANMIVRETKWICKLSENNIHTYIK